MKKIFLLIFISFVSFAQQIDRINPDLKDKRWSAYWLLPDDSRKYGVYHFRKTVDLPSVPKEFIIHVTADNRYELFVNEKRVCLGPARGDLNHWQYETIDIAPFLKPGKNVLASVVWNAGSNKPVAQMSDKTAFILQGNTKVEEIVNTDQTWKMIENTAYSPYSRPAYFGTPGACEKVDGNLYIWNWQKIDFDDSKWQKPFTFEGNNGFPKSYILPFNTWQLIPREIPLLIDSVVRIQKIARTEFINIKSNFQFGKSDLIVPPKTKCKILLDQTYLTNAYPEILVSKGKKSSIELIYTEALFDEKIANYSKDPAEGKTNRNQIDGLVINGNADIFMPDGGDKRLFRPLWFRCYRYLQIEIETKDEPLIIHDFKGIYTGYPLTQKAKFSSNDDQLTKIWNVGYRTASLCAHETYFDCPYYEQLQYIGDTRIQALISLYVAGDDRLVKNAINQFHYSQTYEGLTRSSYPNHGQQFIPPFSLYWILMINDLRMHTPNDDFCKKFTKGIDGALDWHKQFLSEKNMLKDITNWNFTDWPNEWKWDGSRGYGGIPSGSPKGYSSILNLQYVYTLKIAAEMYQEWGMNLKAQEYRNLANTIQQATFDACWSAEKGLIADTPEKLSYSQHANLWLIMNDMLPLEKRKDFMQKIIADKSLIQCTVYYKFYLFQAMKKAGIANQYLDQLYPWKEMLAIGLTTFAERPEPSRSDCHAWSASPNYDLLATVLGVEPASSGFKTIKIKPNLGNLKNASGKVPHPKGEIKVNYVVDSNGVIEAEIILPVNTNGVFIWKDKEYIIKSGFQKFKI